MHFFGKIGLNKFGTRDGCGVEISGSAVWFLSLFKSSFKVNLVVIYYGNINQVSVRQTSFAKFEPIFY